MSIRRGWTIEEDQVLKLLKQERHIKKWSSIAKIMDSEFHMCGRNGKQCRERYNNHLGEGIVEQKLTPEEQKALETLNQQIGNKWSVIARAFKGRTANFLKNQLYSKLRKSIRKLNKFMKQLKIKDVKPYKLNIVYKIVQSNDFKIYEKQRHSIEDLEFYSQIKEKLFRYAQQPLSAENQEKQADTSNESRQLINKLNLFTKKYQALHKKLKKPRKRYFCQDDIILNSLSNNKITKDSKNLQEQKNSPINESDNENSKMSDSQSDESSQTSDKKEVQPQKPQQNKIEIKVFESKNFDNYKNHQFYETEKQAQHSMKQVRRNPKTQKQLQKAANQNCKIVEQGDIDHQNKVNLMLQQSEQCHFMDIQYLDHFKSCSFIDESLFQ